MGAEFLPKPKKLCFQLGVQLEAAETLSPQLPPPLKQPQNSAPLQKDKTKLQPFGRVDQESFKGIKPKAAAFCTAVEAKLLSATSAGAGMQAALGGGRGKINFSSSFFFPPSSSYHSSLLFHDSAPEECRLPWKPFLGPLVGGMLGLLSLEQLWQGESRECFEDGLRFFAE